MTAGGTGAAVTVSHARQAYWGRIWRCTKNWAGSTSSCSLISSPILTKSRPHCPQVQDSGSCRCSIRGNSGGNGLRPGCLPEREDFAAFGDAGSNSAAIAARSSSQLSLNRSRWAALNASAFAPKRIRFRRANSKVSFWILSSRSSFCRVSSATRAVSSITCWFRAPSRLIPTDSKAAPWAIHRSGTEASDNDG